MKISCGRLIHSSVTSGSASSGRSASSVRSSADAPGAAGAGGGAGCSEAPADSGSAARGTQLIYGPEVEVAGHQNLDAVSVVLDDRGRNGHGILQDFGENVLGARGGIDHGA